MGEELMQLYNTMPLAAQQELYNFALFLTFRFKESEKIYKPSPKSCFGALKDKISYIAPDFDEPLEDFADYM